MLYGQAFFPSIAGVFLEMATIILIDILSTSKILPKKKRYFGCAFPDGTYLSRMILSWNGWGWKECFELIWSKFPSQAESSGAGWPRHFLSEYLFCRRRKLLVSLPLHVFKGILMLVCYYDDIFITIYYYNIFFSTRKLFA